MSILQVSHLVVLTVLAVCVSTCHSYKLVDNFSGSTFFNNWNYFTGADPTHGYVYFASQSQATSWGYTYVQDNVVYIKSDSSSISSGSGRGSVRLTSKKTYGHGLFVFDVKHMPTGCGNWPALWTVGPNWPYSGEIDVVEGVNMGTRNQMTLHTAPGCTMPSNWNEIGSTVTTDCNSANGANGNAGCAVLSTNTQSFGAPFNNNGGGVYAMQWASSGVFVWFFPRNSIPADINNSAPDPSKWGTPSASFPFAGTGPGSCPQTNIANQQIVIDNTFCGDWAGATFNQDGCPGTCQSYVQNNPNSFKEAYWAINSIKYYSE